MDRSSVAVGAVENPEKPSFSAIEFFDAGILRVQDAQTGKYAPLRLHDLQRDFIARTWDEFDPDTGRRRHRVGVNLWNKKLGKTTQMGGEGVYHTLFDPHESSRETYSVSGDLDQSRLSLEMGKKLIRRSPELRAMMADQTESGRGIQIHRDEIIFEDDDGDVHRWRAIASDGPTAHGVNPSLVLADEIHTWRSYELLEAVSFGPQRPNPLLRVTSYLGTKADMREGLPLYDLWARGVAGTDPRMVFSWLHGTDVYRRMPRWLVPDPEAYLDAQRLLLDENGFRRFHENEWGTGTATFLTEQEIADAAEAALDVRVAGPEPHMLAVDYGRTSDRSALTLLRKDEYGRPTVSDVISFQGSKADPVRLEVVEDAMLDLARRFNVMRFVVDPHQLFGTCERVAKALRIPMLETAEAEANPWIRAIVMRPIGPLYLDRMTKALQVTFRSRQIRIPAALADLVAQLGSVITRETSYGVRLDSGVGHGVRSQDDLVVSLGMALLEQSGRGSGVELPAFACRIPTDLGAQCFLFDPAGVIWPDNGYGPQCRDCTGWQAVRGAYQQARATATAPLDLREFNRTKVRRRPQYVAAAHVPDVG